MQIFNMLLRWSIVFSHFQMLTLTVVNQFKIKYNLLENLTCKFLKLTKRALFIEKSNKKAAKHIYALGRLLNTHWETSIL